MWLKLTEHEAERKKHRFNMDKIIDFYKSNNDKYTVLKYAVENSYEIGSAYVRETPEAIEEALNKGAKGGAAFGHPVELLEKTEPKER